MTSGNNLILILIWTPIRIQLDSFPAEAESIQVNAIMLRMTTGKIYFDEINLSVKLLNSFFR